MVITADDRLHMCASFMLMLVRTVYKRIRIGRKDLLNILCQIWLHSNTGGKTPISQLLPDNAAFKSNFVRTSWIHSMNSCCRGCSQICGVLSSLCSPELLLFANDKHFSSLVSGLGFFFSVFQMTADVISVFVCVLYGKGSPDICWRHWLTLYGDLCQDSHECQWALPGHWWVSFLLH